MLMPDVTALLVDPELGAQQFKVKRRTVKWQGGRALPDEEKVITATGIIQPPQPHELSFFPEGERRKGQIVIYTKTTLYLTEGETVSDDVTWQGEQYKVVRVDEWLDYGFCVAYAQKR